MLQGLVPLGLVNYELRLLFETEERLDVVPVLVWVPFVVCSCGNSEYVYLLLSSCMW